MSSTTSNFYAEDAIGASELISDEGYFLPQSLLVRYEDKKKAEVVTK